MTPQQAAILLAYIQRADQNTLLRLAEANEILPTLRVLQKIAQGQAICEIKLVEQRAPDLS